VNNRLERAQAIPETAFTMGLVLLVFFGLVKLALVGYEQSEADGAAFVAAHAAAMTADNTQQVSRGELHAGDVFTRVPSGNISVVPGSPGSGPNGNGEVVGSSYRMTSGLFAGALGSGQFTLKSQVIEPVINSYTAGAGLTASATLQNCLTANPATPSCGSMYLAQIDPSNRLNPYDQFDCHLAQYLPLANGTSGSGTTRGLTPWPEDYRPTTGGSINDPVVRATGIYLTTSGHLGLALAPMYAWTASSPC
jgi:hypothetical protein